MISETPRNLAIVLSGGNALGAFHAGALCEIIRSGLRPTIVAGASVGSICTALFAAPRNGDSEKTLRSFWQEAAQDLFSVTRGQQELGSAILSLLYGRPNLSTSYVAMPGLLAGRNALQELTPLRATLDRLVDFDALSQGSPRCIFGATALQPDEAWTFDTSREAIRADHVLASCALPVLFPPVKINGRTFVDGGVSANLPLEAVMTEDGPSLDCLAFDLFSTGGPVPDTLDASIERLQSQMFAFQSQAILEKVRQSERPTRVIYAAYRPEERESAGKTLDFSRRSIEKRWKAGEEAGKRALARLASPANEVVDRV